MDFLQLVSTEGNYSFRWFSRSYHHTTHISRKTLSLQKTAIISGMWAKLLDSAGYRHIFITYSAETTFCANDYDKKQKFRFLIQKKNVSGELDRNSTCSILEHMANENYICKVNALWVSTIPLLQNAISPIGGRTIYRPPCYEYPTSGHFTFSGIPPFHTAPRHITQKAICRIYLSIVEYGNLAVNTTLLEHLIYWWLQSRFRRC